MRHLGKDLTGDVMTHTHIRPLCTFLQRVFIQSILLLGFIGFSFPFPAVAQEVSKHSSTNIHLVKRGAVQSRSHAPARGTKRIQSRRPRIQPHVAHPHVPRRHVHRHVRRGGRTTTMVAVLPGGCEEVSGEEATFYCEGVYYKAYYQGNRVVYVPEAEIEGD